ncbi:SAM-dependent methyltransferase [Sinorhizobium fredii]|jgi:SAM-dependent methyltransferase|uniref:Putative SAM-dependent methyltransferase protein n=1 Tax=Sinorhizobium fredii (strain USDA 257) TaxID=1185652 RepID=I3XAL7_SINF2|nr:class I SAM-dependent methyltransferase [Sinorhizobium fredii]AFL52923.1 putative SAM-dependent methyltransferase protein [Sinorhizobium fredii USDA 257]
MTTIDDGNARFYRDNAAAYAGRARRTPAARLEKFLARLKPGAFVLELGCGGGQDSAYMLARGFDVTPTDGSPELAMEAERLLGRPVEVVRFEELCWRERFDGIWAEACLLHVPRTELPGVLARILVALKAGGVLHASFKAGEMEGRDGFGRYYNYPSRDWLLRRFEETGWTAIDIEETDGGGYDGKPTRWLHVAASKPDN